MVFCLMMQGVFSLMHECFHHHGCPSPGVNRALGIAASTIFGTSYTLIKINHEGHHVRNRTPAEIAEYIRPGESGARRTFVYYFAILGGHLAGILRGGVCVAPDPVPVGARLQPPLELHERLFPVVHSILRRGLAQHPAGRHPGRGSVGRGDPAVQWELRVLACIYAAFAFSWSSLQWVYHMRTPLHPVEGAYDLRALAPIRWLFLNFNYNLTHHRAPNVPWQEVHSGVNQSKTQPLSYRYLLVFKPPEPLPADPASIVKTYR